VRSLLTLGRMAMTGMDRILNGWALTSHAKKRRLASALVFPATYGWETLTLRKYDRKMMSVRSSRPTGAEERIYVERVTVIITTIHSCLKQFNMTSLMHDLNEHNYVVSSNYHFYLSH